MSKSFPGDVVPENVDVFAGWWNSNDRQQRLYYRFVGWCQGCRLFTFAQFFLHIDVRISSAALLPRPLMADRAAMQLRFEAEDARPWVDEGEEE
jgi:hypothetical protein